MEKDKKQLSAHQKLSAGFKEDTEQKKQQQEDYLKENDERYKDGNTAKGLRPSIIYKQRLKETEREMRANAVAKHMKQQKQRNNKDFRGKDI